MVWGGGSMKSRFAALLGALFLLSCLLTLTGFDNSPRPGQVLDEARVAGRDAASFPPADEDYFHDMDNAIALTPEEIKGRNMWLVWSGGDDRFWDGMTSSTFGGFDLLKIIAYDPTKKIDRDGRWSYLGLINEPCFDPPTGPDKDRFGLLLDARRGDCPPDPFANETKYPGVKLAARGSAVPIGSYYGYPSGIVGLRLFPNPEFDEAAAKHWDATKYFTDATYYNDKNLVRPYRVGMSCGFCHIGPSPINPPAQPAHPQWANLSSTVGAQYMWVDRLFIYSAARDNFMFQLVHTYRPGTMDTSLVSTDNINNPRAMNAIYAVKARLDQARRWGKETLAGGQLNNKQFNDLQLAGEIGEYLNQFFEKPSTSWTTHVLKDASDSVGVLGALNRVYLNIGLFSEEWLLHFNAVAGGKHISPIEIAVAEKNSSYWQATEASTPLTALFFLKAARPDKLKDAPGGAKYLTTDQAVLDRGKQVFADTCARCHSSKAPKAAVGLDPAGCAGPGYLDCWSRYWAWTKTDEYKQQMRAIVNAPDFLDDNFMSTEARIPVTLLQTNACSPLATNAIAGNIWDNFASQTYKELPSVGTLTVHNPIDGTPWEYILPAGGRGYTRPPALISVWSTAPFLLNNSVGTFHWQPSLEARMASFNDAIQKLLWPEKRDKDPVLGDKVPGYIYRTTATSYVKIASGYLHTGLRQLLGWGDVLQRFFPWLFREGMVRIGPIPKGTPVNLLSNLNLEADKVQLVTLVAKMIKDLKAVEGASDEEAARVFKNLVP